MSLTRRAFLDSSTRLAAGAVLAGAVDPLGFLGR